MTAWNPQGWVIMLAGQQWAAGKGFAIPIQSGLDFHLDVQAHKLRATYVGVGRFGPLNYSSVCLGTQRFGLGVWVSSNHWMKLENLVLEFYHVRTK